MFLSIGKQVIMSLIIRPIEAKSDVVKFVKCQWDFYKDDPNWVPPMKMDRMNLLNKKTNPFYQHSLMQLFLAEDNGKIVGRIAAIINDNHNKTHNDKVGFFGFFECVNDQNVADLLFNTANDWLKSRGMDTSRGPVNPSLNDET
ncbi:MAG: GNAT family N-acetyltransferase, partial [Chlorobi bacterium]|nr:GNAT family N-acetyltransferase [Chlorobiota bacterium]